MDYLAEAVTDPTSALLVSGERSLAAEFPPESQARLVLSAIGSGERAFSTTARATGDMPQASLARALRVLVGKRILESATPLSIRPSRETRYTVADPHLRFWLAFLGPHLPEIERGRGDRTAERIRTSRTSWRGRAIEPVDAHDLANLIVHRGKVPGADETTPLLAVAPSGLTTEGVQFLGPDDLIATW
jgi:hypothetical protein